MTLLCMSFGAGIAGAQQPCASARLQLETLTNQLLILEGQKPLGASVGSTLPKQIDDGSTPPTRTVDTAGIAAWHKANDATVVRLTAELGTAACALPPPPPLPFPYNLVYTQLDDTGVALSPEWQSTQVASIRSAPDPKQCGGGDPWKYPCTNQTTEINNDKGLCPTGNLGGHANFIPATYTGRLTWESHSLESQDDDYNFGLLPWIPQSSTPWITSADDALAGLHLEFSSDETIDHFHTPWWKSFHEAVDSDDSRSIDNPFGQPRREMVSGTSHALAMLNGNYAIVTGLVGLDCAHSCGAEVHPVWAMAIHVKDDPNDDTWAFFARNGGNEGYCGPKTEILDTTSFTFRLPWRPGATAANVAVEDLLWRDSSPATYGFNPIPGTGVLVTFMLNTPGKGDRMNGDLHIKWVGQPQAQFLAAAPIDATKLLKTDAKADPEDDPEVAAAITFSKLSAAQKAAVLAKLPQPDLTPDASPGRLKAGLAGTVTKMPAVTSAVDDRGAQRMQQRQAAISAAKVVPK